MHELGYKPKAPRLTIKLAMQMISCNRSYLELYHERVERGINVDINQKLIDEHEDANDRLRGWIWEETKRLDNISAMKWLDNILKELGINIPDNSINEKWRRK